MPATCQDPLGNVLIGPHREFFRVEPFSNRQQESVGAAERVSMNINR
jgi:hypothetical protein